MAAATIIFFERKVKESLKKSQAAHRSNQDLAAKEKENADAMARMAAHRSNQDLAAKEKYHADAMARMAAPREVPREVW